MLQKCKICNVSVWEQPWKENKTTSNVNCNESYETNVDVSNLVSKINNIKCMSIIMLSAHFIRVT